MNNYNRTTNFIFLIVLYFSVQFSYSQEYYYWYKNQKVPLILNTKKTYLTFNNNSDKRVQAASLNIEYSKFLKYGTLNIRKGFSDDVAESANRTWCFLDGTLDDKIKQNQSINYNAPFFYTSDGVEAGLSHLFYVKLKKPADIKILNNYAKNYNVQVLGQNKFMPLWFTLSCSKDSYGNSLELANLFYESGQFAAAEPDLMTDDKPLCTNDPFFNSQWGLNNTGQYGGGQAFDINYCAARQISTGDPNIIVAILDQGVELNHPDLTNMHPVSFDSETMTSPSQVLGNHGTAVAGIIGADDNNIGITGISPGCQIMSISNSLAGTPNSRIRRADGINFAVNNGADVINNSLEFSSTISNYR